MCPSPADKIDITSRARNAPMKTIERGCCIASKAANKNVLSPISDTIIMAIALSSPSSEGKSGGAMVLIVISSIRRGRSLREVVQGGFPILQNSNF